MASNGPYGLSTARLLVVLILLLWLPWARAASQPPRGLACSVVHLNSSQGRRGPDRAVLPPAGSCTGILLDDAGHLVAPLSCLLHRFEVVATLCDSSSWPVRFVGSDRDTGMAVLQLRAPPSALLKVHPAILGTLEGVVPPVPLQVVAMPRPGWVVSHHGELAAPPWTVRSSDGAERRVIYTTFPWSPLINGGLVADSSGRAVGMVVDPGPDLRGALGGFGLALPGGLIQSVASTIISRGPAPRPWLGADFMDITPTLASLFDLPVKQGVMVVKLAPHGPGERAGLMASRRWVVVGGVRYPVGGDIIVAADGHPVHRLADLLEVLRAKAPGDRIRLRVMRQGRRRLITVKLGRRQ